MSITRPAWSWQFESDALRPFEPLRLPEPITPEWAWEGATGKGVKVAVVDSGVDPNHPAVGPISGGVIVEWDPDAEGEVKLTEEAHEDLFGHGTACAGIIRKVAPECEIYSVRVLGKLLTSKAVVFAAGLKWAIDNGMHVANLSLSTNRKTYFGLFHEIVDDAYFHNMMLVSAINNEPEESYPSQYSTVFSVAAHMGQDPFAFDYNPTPPVEFGAPGINVDVAWKDGSTIKATGNSFAAPHIAGIVTRILSKHPGLTPFQMKTILHSLATNRNRNG